MELRPYDKVMPIHVSWLNSDLMTYSEQRHYVHTGETVERYRKSVTYMWGVWNGPIFVGTIAGCLDEPNDVVDLGMLIGDPGQGFGLKAWKLALDALSSHRRITAGCMVANRAMFRILSKTMQFDHQRGGMFLLDGKPHDGVFFKKDK